MSRLVHAVPYQPWLATPVVEVLSELIVVKVTCMVLKYLQLCISCPR